MAEAQPSNSWGSVQTLNALQSLLSVFDLPDRHAAAWGFASTFILCNLLVITQGWHGKFSLDQNEGIQKSHSQPTSRIGGLPIVLGLIMAWSQTTDEVEQLLTPFLLAGLPALLFGLAEDFTKEVGVTPRLLATMASGFLAWWITDYSLTRLDIWGVNWVMSFTIVSVVFTAFAVGGVANSINIIDGFNGLSSTMSTLGFVGYAFIAWQVGDTHLASVSLVLAACVFGFFWVNWPYGRLFMGDGGAYFVGFSLAWVAVLLIERNPSVSAFAVLLVCAHPVTEVLFSIYRRKIRNDHPGMPDRLHFHSLFKRRFVRRVFSGHSQLTRNSISGVMVGGLSVIPVTLALFSHSSTLASVLCLVLVCLGYVSLYARLVRFHWCSPITFLLTKPAQSLRVARNTN